jgi:nitrous oxidase accessory protein NosD
MSGNEVVGRARKGSSHSGDRIGDPTLLGRKSVLLGMLTSGFVVANAAHPSAAMAGTIKPASIAATQPTYVTRWTPSTAYALGQQVISPYNDVVSAKAAHTSSAAYSSDTAKWALSTTLDGLYAQKPQNGARAVGQGEQIIHAANYASLSLALAAAVPGTTVLLTGSGTNTSGVTVPDDVTLEGRGNAKITLSGASSGYVVALGNRSRLIGVTLDSAALAGQGGVWIGSGKTDAEVTSCHVVNAGTGSGFSVRGAVRATLTNCSSHGAQNGISIQAGAADTLIVGGSHLNGTATNMAEGSIYIPNAMRTRIMGVTVAAARGHGLVVLSSASDTTIESCTFLGNGTAGGTDYRGISVAGGVARVRVIGCDLIGNQECGAYVEPTATHIDFLGCRMVGNNVGFRPGGHGIEHLGTGKISACRSIDTLGDMAGAGCGFYIGGNGASVVDCDACNNWSAGIRSLDSDGALIANCRCMNNSQRAAGGNDGIEVLGLGTATCTNVQIIGNRCWDDQVTKTQRYGISTSSGGNGGVDYYVIANNNTRGNAVGGISDGTSNHKVVANNL